MTDDIERVYSGFWVNLPVEVKLHLAEVFGVPRTGSTHVVDNRVVSDGYSDDNLSAVTTDKLADYTKQQGTFAELLKKAIEKAQAHINGEPEPVEPIIEPVKPVKKEKVVTKVIKSIKKK